MDGPAKLTEGSVSSRPVACDDDFYSGALDNLTPLPRSKRRAAQFKEQTRNRNKAKQHRLAGNPLSHWMP